ncbi:hypothetical protein [Aeromicrobium sp. CF3.5]|uniref:hypothetical protein n=1 Tax=Aeromicrobium sp. CF3.5 TaxID=3373078 RepID=UPI003EE5768B
MQNPHEASFLDGAALDEIELTSQLMIAATDCVDHLTQCEVDRILGVTTVR